MENKKYRIRNWKDYTRALTERGNIEIWFSDEAIKSWAPKTKERNKRGRPIKYGNVAIECALTLKYVYQLPFRQTEGFLKSLIRLLGLNIVTPDYTTVCKRQNKVDTKLFANRRKMQKVYLIFDSSGLKVFGEGEWKVRQHGYSKRRRWRKIHVGLGINSNGGMRIENVKLTDQNTLDGHVMPKMLEEIEGEIKNIMGDGSYGAASNYEEAAKRKAKLIVPPKKGAKINLMKAKTSIGWKEKNANIRLMYYLGKDRWKEKTKYNKRSLVENVFFRLKTILGPKLSGRKFSNQEIEVLIKCKILNRMSEIGMPDSYRMI